MATIRPRMAARPLHLFEARGHGAAFHRLQEAPAALGPLLAERLGAEKRVRIPFNPRERWLSAARRRVAAFRTASWPPQRGRDRRGHRGRMHPSRRRTLRCLTAEPELSLVYSTRTATSTRWRRPLALHLGHVLAHLCGRSWRRSSSRGAQDLRRSRGARGRAILVGARSRTSTIASAADPFNAEHSEHGSRGWSRAARSGCTWTRCHRSP